MARGSLQLTTFRIAIRDGETLERACALSTISLAEAKIHLANDQRNPPPPEAFEVWQPEEEAAMAAAAKKEDGPQEIPQKDFAQAVKIYRQDIKPAKTKQGEFGQEQSTAFKAIKKTCHIQPQAAKLAFNVSEMEDAHRDDFLICLNGLFKELGIVMPRDLVTIADGDAGGEVIPIGERKRPQLATLAGDPDLPMGVPSDGTETDLAEAGEDDFEEADEDELAAQRDRPSVEAEQAEEDAESEREAAE